jgi:glycosyltransferase involved in cell wall biosynthesis
LEPLVSIIIPLYNSKKHIAKCIKSAVDQTWLNKEIIVVNDGSTDQSLEIAKAFESDLLKVFSQENKGASAARNFGIRESKGDYIQFLDADDLLSPNKIECQIKSLKGSFDKLSVCATVHFFDETNHTDPLPIHEWYREGSDDPIDFLIKLYGGGLIGPTYGGMIQPNAWLTPKKIIDKAGDWNETLSLDDDGEFFCRILLASKGVRYSYDGINYYRKFKNAGSLSASASYKAMKSALESNLLKSTNLLQHSESPLAKKALARFFMENAFNFYPQFKDLSDIAEKKANELGGCEFEPYPKGYKKILNLLLGWKQIKKLEFVKRKYSTS